MNSTAGSGGRQIAAEKSQYHHFIPRFILRNFAQDQPQTAKRKSHGRTRKDGLLRFISTRDGVLSSGPLSRHYGFKDMYRYMYAAEQHGLETKFSRLEGQAAEVIRKAKTTFFQPGASLTLTRPEKDTLRKFLFLMKYRNTSFSSRFDVPTINEYTAADKDKLARYMRLRGFRSPRGVWLANMHAFLDITIDPQRNWHAEIRLRAYPDDATLFIIHVEQSYMAFCRPKNIGDEFLLTENAFGIFEGPHSFRMDPATGELSRGIWMEWHNFAPLSPTLLIVLRNNYLLGNIQGASIHHSNVYDILRLMHHSPEQAGSMLPDLPVRRCTTSYLDSASGRAAPESNYHGPSVSDQYTFECFELESAHMDRINSIFLEEALMATSIVFKGDTAAARAIRSYLEDPQPGLKTVSRDGMDRYLNALATALQNLGGKANTIRNNIACPISFEERQPLDFAGHMAQWATFHTAVEIQKHHPRLLETYQTLGGSSVETPEAMRKWYNDVQQAAKITFLHNKIDSALSGITTDDASKWKCKLARHNFFAKLHPCRIWLHVKALRNLDRLDPEDFSRQIGPLRCEGLEDEVVRGKSDFTFRIYRRRTQVWLWRRHVCADGLSAALLFTIGQD